MAAARRSIVPRGPTIVADLNGVSIQTAIVRSVQGQLGVVGDEVARAAVVVDTGDRNRRSRRRCVDIDVLLIGVTDASVQLLSEVDAALFDEAESATELAELAGATAAAAPALAVRTTVSVMDLLRERTVRRT